MNKKDKERYKHSIKSLQDKKAVDDFFNYESDSTEDTVKFLDEAIKKLDAMETEQTKDRTTIGSDISSLSSEDMGAIVSELQTATAELEKPEEESEDASAQIASATIEDDAVVKTKDTDPVKKSAPDSDDSLSGLVAGVVKFMVDAATKILSSFIAALAKITQKAYKNIHADPYKKTADYLRSGAEAGIEYTGKDMEEMYRRYQEIGKLNVEQDAELTGEVGITGRIGEGFKKIVGGAVEYLTDAEETTYTEWRTLEDESQKARLNKERLRNIREQQE